MYIPYQEKSPGINHKVRIPCMKITLDPSQIRAQEATTRPTPSGGSAMGNPRQEGLPKDGINLRQVQEVPECPVCINIPRPPIYNSYTGLILSGGCKDASALGAPHMNSLEIPKLEGTMNPDDDFGKQKTPKTVPGDIQARFDLNGIIRL
ncbi:unnamed protein product [Allacma fusca]|uniref:Uncharacterized protein n=1 Tax=Allacma fusca TaxID=39272 RepID=A0A8J2JFY8_9HEXA|nr:unnamed protein product [Allacma fusca]